MKQASTDRAEAPDYLVGRMGRKSTDANRRLAPEIDTVIIPTAQEYAHISSTAVRDLIKHNSDTSMFIPEGVDMNLLKKE